MQQGLRSTVDQAIQDRQNGLALARLDQLLREAPTIANAQFVVDRMRSIGNTKPPVAMRLAILRSFTLEPVVPMLKAAAILHGLELEIWLGGFNSYTQEMLDAGSGLYQFEPDVVLLAAQTRDLVPQLWIGGPGLATTARRSVDQTVTMLRDWIGAFRSRSAARVILQNLQVPDAPALGILDAQAAGSQRQAVQDINRELAAMAAELTGVHVLDYDSLVARHGSRNWHDARKWLTARMPIAADCVMPLAQEYLRFLLPLAGISAKVLAVDLDNTLWGGVIGEDGIEGIKLGPEYPGAAYQNVQRVLQALRARGVLLAIVSKNNVSDALEAVDRHAEMLLRSGDFVAHRINWNDKAQSLREIAAELNIGLDAVAFLDDNPAERERIRLELPEVTVIELPADPLMFERAVWDCPVFERLSLSVEDRERGRLYAEEKKRTQLQSSSASLEDFLRSLDMEMDMRQMSPDALTRVAQLTQKTNQFNLTTRRYTEPQLLELARNPTARVYHARVRDRLGDNGIVGVAITQHTAEEWEIDTFLLSCRVIGRTIEQAMLSRIADDARAAGARWLRGWFLASRKNEPAGGFYAANGFSLVMSGDGGSRWELDLLAQRPTCPGWIACRDLAGDGR